MTEQEVNKILEVYESNPFRSEPSYTTNWNDFHRVWMKFGISDYLVIKQIQQLITHDPTPFQASYQLAKIIKLGK